MVIDNVDIIQEIIPLLLTSTVITAIITSIIQLIKWKEGEKGQSNATSVKMIAEASAMLVEPLKHQINEILEQNNEMEKKFIALQEEYFALKMELSIMKDWAERLANQVVSMGGTPVKRKRIDKKLDEAE